MNILWTICIFTVALKVGAGVFLQTAEVQVLLGESVILPCNGSRFPVDELQVHWEAMGKDVISLHGDVLSISKGFEDRVNFISDPTRTEDFSIILTDVMLNDGEIYECLWEGTQPICSVLVHVLTPSFSKDEVESFEGEDTTLDCFGNIPKNKPWEDIYIQWIKDGQEIMRLSSGKTEVMINYSIITLPTKQEISRGIFSLTISSVSVSDQGVYQCRYKSSDYGDPLSGFPETSSLTVWAVFSGQPAVTDSLTGVSEFSSPSTSTSPTLTSAVSAETEAGSTAAAASSYATTTLTEINNTLPTYTYDTNTERTEETHTDGHTTSYSPVMTDVLLLETATVSGRREPLELLWDQQIPWIRIGLIAGVLLLTALVLAVLLLSGRI